MTLNSEGEIIQININSRKWAVNFVVTLYNLNYMSQADENLHLPNAWETMQTAYTMYVVQKLQTGQSQS